MAEMLLMNPVKKRRKKRKTTAKKKPVKRRALSTVTKRRSTTRRYRKNPARRKMGNIINDTIMPSAVAAGGALGLDMMMAYLPIPENLKTGPMQHLVKGAGAIGMGMLAGMFLKPKTAELITTGALTVVIHNAGKDAIQKFAPDVRLSSVEDDDYDDLSYVSPGMPVGEYLGEYESNTMDAYLDGVSLEEELEL